MSEAPNPESERIADVEKAEEMATASNYARITELTGKKFGDARKEEYWGKAADSIENAVSEEYDKKKELEAKRYTPTEEDYKNAEAELTPETASRSSRRSASFRSDNLEDLKASDLKVEEDREKDEIIVRGTARGHDIWVKCVGLINKENPICTASIDGGEEITGGNAEALFGKYYSLAKFQNL